MATTVDSLLADAQNYIDIIRGEAEDALERLESYATLPFQTWVEFADRETVELQPTPNIAANYDMPTLEKVPFDVAIGDFDPEGYKSNVYDSAFFTFLEPYLTEQIENGGPGISDAVQDALWDNQSERDLQLMNDALDQTRRNYAKTGFPLPTSMLRAQENEVIKKYQDDRSNRNREITALIAERSVDFIKSAIVSGINMEEARMNFAGAFARIFNDTTTALINRFKAEQEARVVEFKGEVDVILADLQIGKINADIDLSYQAQLLKKWEVESNNAISRTKALISQAEETTKVKLGSAQSLAQFYASLGASAASQVLGGKFDNSNTTVQQG